MKLTAGDRRGPLYLERDPLVAAEAATKNYVDSTVYAHSENTALHLTQTQKDLLDSLNVDVAELNYLNGLTGNVQSQLDTKLNKSGGTMTGTLVLAADPLNDNDATTKAYTDAGLALKFDKTGGTVTGFITLHAAPTNTMHAANKQYVDTGLSSHATDTGLHLVEGERLWLSAVVAGVTSTEVNRLAGVTSGVQEQLDSKLDKSGGTMTGFVTLHAAPTDNMHPATKQYTDTGLNTKFDKSGGNLTGFATLHADPTANMHAATKQYTDAGLSTHAGDDTLHLTSEQNAFLDAVTVSATEVNRLTGVTSDVQSQIDSKFDKAGGTITGDVTVAPGYAIYVSKTATSSNELVNKAYVDALQVGQRWEDPIVAANLVSANLGVPPVSPVEGDVYIVPDNGSGLWAALRKRAVTYRDGSWVDILGRDVAAGDRFGVVFSTATAAGADLNGSQKRIIKVMSIGAGPTEVLGEAVQISSTTLVYAPLAPNFGVTYTYKSADSWAPTNTSVNIAAGDALELTSNMLHVRVGTGLIIGDDKVRINVDSASAVIVNGENQLSLEVDEATLTQSGAYLHIADAVMLKVNDSVQKSGTNTVSGSITVTGAGALLRYTNAPLVGDDVTNKTYVDTAVTGVADDLSALTLIVDALNTDPTTKTYVDNQDALKVNKAGDTLTGFLVLHAAPESAMHPTNKQYVDTNLSTHATDTDLHISPIERNWLSSIVGTVTSDQVNYLSGVTSDVQDQIDSKVAIGGDTMTGPLYLHANPTGNLMAAPKQYVDAVAALKFDKTGGEVTGFITLHADPTLNLHAVTKQYADAALTGHASDDALHLTSGQNAFLDALTVSATEVNYLGTVSSNVQDQLDSKLNKAGGEMSGFITLHAAPTLDLHASTKKYVDDAAALKVNKAGDTLTGFLTLHAAPTDAMHAANKEFVESAITAAAASLGGDVSTKVSKSGDTMTGPLLLAADPVADLGAATKQFVEAQVDGAREALETTIGTVQTNVSTLRSDVDGLLVDPVTKTYVDSQDNTRLAKSGGTMTGYITLHADPSSAMHPTTKQYVDAVAQGLINKPSVRLATTEALAATYSNGTSGVNATLTGTANGGLVVDGKVVAVNDRILVRLQAAAIQNGDYTVQQTGDAGTPFILKRVVTADESSEIPRSYFYVFDGDTLKGTGWTLVVQNPVTFTIGTDDISVNQFSGQGSLIAGNGLTISGNTIQINSANTQRIIVNADNIDLATTGVTPGTYTKVVIDGYGRATAGSNPTTLGGYGITDAQGLNSFLTDISLMGGDEGGGGLIALDAVNMKMVRRTLSTTGIGISVSNNGTGIGGDLSISSNATPANTGNTLVSRDSNGDFAAREITAALKGNADTATKLATSRQFSADSVDMSAPAVSFDGSANVTLVPVLKASGITAGTYTKLTVTNKGIATGGENPTTLAGYGITDAATITQLQEEVALLRTQLTELYSYVMARM